VRKDGASVKRLNLRNLIFAGAFMVAVGFAQHAKRFPADADARWILFGAHCTVSQVPPLRVQQFREIATVSIGKTSDKEKVWVVSFTDYDGCVLSFWTSGGELDKPIPVTGITPY